MVSGTLSRAPDGQPEELMVIVNSEQDTIIKGSKVMMNLKAIVRLSE